MHSNCALNMPILKANKCALTMPIWHLGWVHLNSLGSAILKRKPGSQRMITMLASLAF